LTAIQNSVAATPNSELATSFL